MESQDDLVPLYVRIPRRIMEDLRQLISQELGFGGYKLVSVTVARALNEYIERKKNPGDAAHTHKSSFDNIAENIPASHRRSRKTKVDNEPIPTPTPMPMSTNPLVLTNNGKSSGEDRQSKPDFDWFECANRMGVLVEDKHVQRANKMRSDPAEMKQMFSDWINRLKAKSKRHVVSDVDKKTSERRKEHTEIMNQIVAYIRNNPNSRGISVGREHYSVDDGLISKDDLEQGIRAIIPRCNDDRPVKNKIKMFEASGIITWTNFDQGRIFGKPSGKPNLSRGAYKINMDSL